MFKNIKPLKAPKFSTKVPKNLSLNSILFVYKDGLNYKIVPKDTASYYPIIYDKYHENGAVYDISVTFCPNTMCATGYFGKFKLDQKLRNNNIVLCDNKKKKIKVVQLTGDVYDMEDNPKSDQLVRRLEVKMGTMRDVLSKFPDSRFLVTPVPDYKPLKMVVDFDINTRTDLEYHPMTYVYGIEYMSTDVEYKHSMIIGKGSSLERTNSISDRESGFKQYFDKMNQKIDEKLGILIPCYFFAWISFYSNTRVVRLDKQSTGGFKLLGCR